MANNIFNTIIKHKNRDAVKTICGKTKLEYRNNGRYARIKAGTLKSMKTLWVHSKRFMKPIDAIHAPRAVQHFDACL